MFAAEGGASEPKINFDFQNDIIEARESFITFFQENRDVLFKRPKDASLERICAELEKIFDDPQVDPDARPQLLVLSLKPYATELLRYARNYLNFIKEFDEFIKTVNNAVATERTELLGTEQAQQNQFIRGFNSEDSDSFVNTVRQGFARQQGELKKAILAANQCIENRRRNPVTACIKKESPKFAIVEEFDHLSVKRREALEKKFAGPAVQHKASVSSDERGNMDLPADDKTPLLHEKSISVGSDDSSGGKALCGDAAQPSVLSEENDLSDEERASLKAKEKFRPVLAQLESLDRFNINHSQEDGATTSAPFFDRATETTTDPNASLLANSC